jgi:serine/threonine protein kinase
MITHRHHRSLNEKSFFLMIESKRHSWFGVLSNCNYLAFGVWLWVFGYSRTKGVLFKNLCFCLISRPYTMEAADPHVIEPYELDIGEKLDEGHFGALYRGRCRGREVSVNVLLKEDLDHEKLAEVRKEVEVIARLLHPNILCMIGACFSFGRVSLVFECVEKSVKIYLREGHVSRLRRVQILKQVAQGMNLLHDSGIIHQGLKPGSLFIDSELTVKIGVFGMAAVTGTLDGAIEKKGKVFEAPLYTAPELLIGSLFDSSVDVYSFAITAWEVFGSVLEFPRFENLSTFQKAVCHDHMRPRLSKDLPKLFQALLVKCWDNDPKQRPVFSEILVSLNDILIDLAISDPFGNSFWKTSFLACEIVEWGNFADKLVQFLGTNLMDVNNDQSEKLKFLHFAVDRSLSDFVVARSYISIESFGRVLSIFGPMDKDGYYLERIREVLLEEWFHGEMSSKEAEILLSNNNKKGTFLVRLSMKQEGGWLAVSRVGSTGISHQLIRFNSALGIFTFRFRQGNTTRKIEQACSLSTFVTKFLSQELALIFPCPGSRFACLRSAPKLKRGEDMNGYSLCDESEA